jgi:hypothetical protein
MNHGSSGAGKPQPQKKSADFTDYTDKKLRWQFFCPDVFASVESVKSAKSVDEFSARREKIG